MARIVGIDPGLEGAIVCLDIEGQAITAAAMPVYSERRSKGEKSFVDEADVVAIFRAMRPTAIWIEDVFSSSQMGVTSAFSFGEGKGILKGAAAGVGIKPRYVSSARWKGELNCTANKRQTKGVCHRFFPQARKLLKSSGKAEAALIALYGALSDTVLFATASLVPSLLEFHDVDLTPHR